MPRAIDPFGYCETPNLMAFLTAYFDESGKLKGGQRVISFCGFVADSDAWTSFHSGWKSLLRRAGLPVLKASNVCKYRTPLSAQTKALGIDSRVEALLPFIRLMRSTLEFGVASAVDVDAFVALPTEARRRMRDDPHYLAFAAAIQQIMVRLQSDNDALFGLMCDEEERVSPTCLALFTRLRTAYPLIRKKFVSIGFGDDKYFTQLQAADLFAYLSRCEAEHKFFGAPFDLRPLYQEFNMKNPEWCPVEGRFFNRSGLDQLAASNNPIGFQ